MTNYHEDLSLIEMEECFLELKKVDEINEELLEFSYEDKECE
jgi:hypothetical protein